LTASTRAAGWRPSRSGIPRLPCAPSPHYPASRCGPGCPRFVESRGAWEHEVRDHRVRAAIGGAFDLDAPVLRAHSDELDDVRSPSTTSTLGGSPSMPEILPDRHSGLLFERLEHPPSPARPDPGSAKNIRAPPFVQQPRSDPAESPEHLRKTTTHKIRPFPVILQAPETSSKPSRCLHTAEIAGSKPASPTLKICRFAGELLICNVDSKYSLNPCEAKRIESCELDLPYRSRPSGGTSWRGRRW
jgi:hypothetical protein